MEINQLYQEDTTLRGEEFDFLNFRRFLHYPAERELPQNISGFLDAELLPDITHHPVARQYRLVPITGREVKQKKVYLGDNIHFTGPLIYNLLLYCDYIVAHVLTIQSEQRHEDWQSFVSYCFYNTLIQSSSELLRDQILSDLDLAGDRLTQRYAPGYCGWPLEDQARILKLLDPRAIGIILDNSMSLHPTHTITGVYGVRQKSAIREKMPCYSCTSIACAVHDDFIKEIS